jgi:hypothetical protein
MTPRNVHLVLPPQPAVSMWAVYDHPLDDPDVFIARRWEVRGLEYRATQDTKRDTDIEAIRDELRAMGLHRIKEGGGDPVVIETWL